MLVYTQTSPDMNRMVHELTTLSEMTTGGLDLEIWYDDNDGVSWPMQWYLRDFPNRHLYGSTLAGPPDGVPIVLVGDNNRTSVEPYLEGYTAQEYALRWWFPERIYRDFAIAPEITPSQSAWGSADNPHNLPAIAGSVLSSLSTLLSPEAQQRLYRLVMYPRSSVPHRRLWLHALHPQRPPSALQPDPLLSRAAMERDVTPAGLPPREVRSQLVRDSSPMDYIRGAAAKRARPVIPLGLAERLANRRMGHLPGRRPGATVQPPRQVGAGR